MGQQLHIEEQEIRDFFRIEFPEHEVHIGNGYWLVLIGDFTMNIIKEKYILILRAIIGENLVISSASD